MPLSWNEIRHRAIAFSKSWADATSEQAEKQTFWNDFFNVFGIQRRAVASFEEPVKKLSGDYSYILVSSGRVSYSSSTGAAMKTTPELAHQIYGITALDDAARRNSRNQRPGCRLLVATRI